MRSRSILIFVLLLTTFGISKAAENQAQKWYWAWRASTKELLAYTADGQVNLLMQGLPVYQIWLGEGNTAIALVADMYDAQYSFYKLTSTEATPIEAQFDATRTSDDIRFWLILQTGSYFLISSSQQPNTVLIDIDKLQAQAITQDESYIFVLSKDRYSVRFTVKADTDSKKLLWDIWEWKLNTGEQTLVYRQPIPFPNASAIILDCVPNTFGDQWLCSAYTTIGLVTRYDDWLLNLDGTTIPIFQNLSAETRGTVLFAGNDLVTIDSTCVINCSIKLYRNEEKVPVLFPIEPQYVGWKYINKVDVIGDDLLLYTHSNEVSRLNRDGKLEYLGKLFCCETRNFSSPDHKWIVLANAKTSMAQLWNLAEDKVEFEYPLGKMEREIDYFELGIAINDLYLKDSWVYLTTVHRPVKITGNKGTFVIDILSDETFLIDDMFDFNSHKPGIYLYNSITNQYTLLVSEAHQHAYPNLSG